MADTYTALEIDQLLIDLKNEMLETIDSTIIMNSGESVPDPTVTQMYLEITKTES